MGRSSWDQKWIKMHTFPQKDAHLGFKKKAKMCANFSCRFCNGTQISLFACETAFPLFFLDFHHISSSGEPSLMFCGVAPSCVQEMTKPTISIQPICRQSWRHKTIWYKTFSIYLITCICIGVEEVKYFLVQNHLFHSQVPRLLACQSQVGREPFLIWRRNFFCQVSQCRYIFQ